jgi:hypothetical protein
MKLLFFSADGSEVEQVRTDLIQAGIACEVRHSPVLEGIESNQAGVELWLQQDEDAHRAWMMCVELGIGFSRRSARIVWLDDLADDWPEARAA